MTPDEARAREGLSPIVGGDSAYMQRQMVPIDKIGGLLDAETEAKKEPPPAPELPAEKPEDKAPDEDAKFIDVELAKTLIESLMLKKAKHD